ncbi:P450-derived glycosyltransferase activator [Actinomadura sp. KC345]|uniref:cytochrome P450 family protein n=1 Tax=Actinomadura sp. KC345 TaxID=2530371 RepID=UPI001050C39B|nr:P450-derived glycosyltransferase activator [Actinomadura sp. KC345]TDC45408.1 P450-derived glycosyltransferase activator [Actinomadura sp. KC345]
MAESMTDSELGGILLTLRGVQWIIGTKNDPYALLLRVGSDDPHGLGHRMRERGALYWSHAEAWVTAAYETGLAALDHPLLSPRRPGADDPPAPTEGEEAMPWELPTLNDVLPLDEAYLDLRRSDYERLRRAVEPVIGAAALERLRPEITRVYEQGVAAAGERFDLMDDLARPCAATVVAELLGVAPGRRREFAELSAGAAGALDATMCPPQLHVARTLTASLSGLHDLMAEAVEARRREPHDDVLAALLEAFAGGDAPGPDALAVSMLLAVTGVEIAANLVCTTMSSLLDHADQWKALRTEPGLAAAAVEETLRYAPPVRLARLFAQEDVELAGQRIEAGGEVVVVAEATGRDPAVHTDPDRFDLGRRGPAPLALHEGLHGGILAPLARLQAVVAVQTLAAEAPEIRRTDAVLHRLRSPVTSAVLRFPVAAG